MNDEMKKDLEARTRGAQNDSRTTDELVSIALAESDEDKAWEAVVTLQYRGTKEVSDAARHLCASECSQERTLGADILGQLGIPARRFPAESGKILVGTLGGETDEDVLDAICTALGHIHDPATVPALARFKTHPSAKVRYAVAFALAGFEDRLAVNSLIELSRDEDELVRDWATFGLGTQIDANTPEIRAALLARVADADEATRGEALVGLARRKDQRIVEPLIEELERHHEAEYGSYALEAAEELADARLLPVLTRLKQSLDNEDPRLDEAIRRCAGGGVGDEIGG
jgi:HEAT repeat protein